MTDHDQPTTSVGDKEEKEASDIQGKPVRKLLVLPGMDGTGLLLNPFIESLGRRVDAQLFDYPTHVIQSYEEIISNVEAMLPRTGEDFAILAESFAGPVALSLAQKGIPGLRALILVVSFAATPRHFLLQLTRYLPMDRLLGLPVPRRFARRLMLGGSAPEGTLDKLFEVFYMISPEVLASRLDEMRKLTLHQEVLDMPAMYIQATDDLLLPDNALNDVKAFLPQIEVHRIDGPHLILDTQPKTCARLVVGFLESLEYEDFVPTRNEKQSK
jgi:pimeloyl-ACP methyl ester carboxylesterase